EDEAHDEEPQAVRGSRDARRNGRVQDPELLALLSLLHALGELGGLEALSERGVELLCRLVVPGNLEVFLLTPGRVLETHLIGGNGGPQALLLGLEYLEIGLGSLEHLAQAEDVGAGGEAGDVGLVATLGLG